MADKAAGGEMVMQGRTCVAVALSAAQDGLAAVLGDMADSHNTLASHVNAMKESVDSSRSDMDKVFRRIQMLEARNVELIQHSEGRLQKEIQLVREMNDACRRREEDIEWEVQEQRRLLEEAKEALDSLASRPASATSIPANAPVRVPTATNIEAAEVPNYGTGAELDALQERLQHFESVVEGLSGRAAASSSALDDRFNEFRDALQLQLEAVNGKLTANKEQTEVINSRLRTVEQRCIRHSTEIKKAWATMEHQKLDEHSEPVVDRMSKLEEGANAAVKLVETFEERFTQSCNMLDDGLRRLAQGNQETAAMHDRLEFLDSRQEDLHRVQAQFEAWARDRLSPTEQCLAQVEKVDSKMDKIQRHQERLDDDVNKILRLGRILDDKVEVFDDMERRMDRLAEQAQKLMGAKMSMSARCLSCDHAEADESSAGNQRRAADSSTRRGSPPPRQETYDSSASLRPAPKGVINMSFEGPSPAQRRRPQSAGVRRTCDQPQAQQHLQQQLEQALCISGTKQAEAQKALLDVSSDHQMSINYSSSPPCSPIPSRPQSASRQRPQSAGSQRRPEQQQAIVLTVPQVRPEIISNAKVVMPGRVFSGPVKPTRFGKGQRPQSARQAFSHPDRLEGC
eukprot:TRINITY_DN27786_c0_g1_i1.p1 TRINITY_DN27786_c0_g1~~TRINITY_DN27786_c0_g1_i1.p1  ORF type:complete len:627 (+),score=139.50 TRINITY_DN27786_c0_g1_i1:144-2024(+)